MAHSPRATSKATGSPGWGPPSAHHHMSRTALPSCTCLCPWQGLCQSLSSNLCDPCQSPCQSLCRNRMACRCKRDCELPLFPPTTPCQRGQNPCTWTHADEALLMPGREPTCRRCLPGEQTICPAAHLVEVAVDGARATPRLLPILPSHAGTARLCQSLLAPGQVEGRAPSSLARFERVVQSPRHSLKPTCQVPVPKQGHC
mmetsp:Transcript_56114/g.131369  ORF Transcript_56114/g.131369 Transcript_56114/m.131369 type:complete len:201 (-) Transcript_56114:540-1142(-)